MMFAVGHLALGYILAKTTSQALRVKMSLPLIFLLSVLPDIDLFIPALVHRGPLHSIIIITLAFVPFFLYYRKQAAPPYVAIMQHSLIGDFLSGGIQLLWPLSYGFYGLNLQLGGLISMSFELISVIVALVILFVTRDMSKLLQSKKENLLLIVPEGAIAGSIFLSWGYALSVELFVAHLVFFVVFGVGILASVRDVVFSWFRRLLRRS